MSGTRFPNGLTANLTGNVTGNVTGNITGAVTATTVTASSPKTDYQVWIGPKSPNFATGTWTYTRIAEANYVMRHTATAETSIISVDLTSLLRTTASKGYQLNTIDYIYSVGTAAMTSHSCTLDKVNYANNAAVTITSVPVTGTLQTATQANPYVTTVTVTTPAFNVTGDSHYILEISTQNAATTAYDFYGIVLNLSRNDL